MGKKTNLIVGAVSAVAATTILTGCDLYGSETYTITFNTNGGEKIADISCEWGKEANLPTNPTKKGYTFAGWYFDSNLTNKVSENLVIQGDITLFAKWNINQYTISFNTNGGTQVPSVKQNYNSTVQVQEPTREGYVFKGWYVDEKFNEEFQDKVPAENITVYAKWEANVVRISFNQNGNKVVGELAEKVYSTNSENLTLPENVYTREGYTFKGWSTTPTGEVEFEDQANISSLTKESQSITFYAVWEANEYTIRLIHNNETFATIVNGYEEAITLPTEKPSRTGHTFKAWGYYGLTSDTTFEANKIYYTLSGAHYEKANVTVGEHVTSDTYYELVEFSATKMPLNGINLYPIWEIESYSITFDEDGGEQVSDITQDYGTSVTLPTPVKVGYTFKGWYEGETLFNANTMPNKNVSVVAKWEANTYRLTFNANGASGSSYQDFVYGTPSKLNAVSFTREGYTFKGWSTSSNGEVVYADQEEYSIPAEATTLYAIWEINSYSITFDEDGGKQVSDINNDYGTSVTLPTPVKVGYTFKGWYEGETLYTATSIPSRDVALKAKWEANTYRLTFNANGASGSSYQDFVYGTPSKLNAVSFTREGYTFKGWSTSSNGEVVYADQEEYSIPAEATTLYAIWEINSYSITFDEDGGNQVTDITQDYGTSVTLPTPVKVGYTFKGWYEGETLYTATSIPSRDVLLKAKWEANTYSIYFDANSGSGTTNKVDATYDVEAILTTNAFSKVGYTFTGWNTKADGSGTSYTDGQTVKNLLSENGSSLTLYAKWEARTDIKYVVNIFTRNLDGYLEELQSYQDQGTSDTTVTLELLDYTGYITPENVQVYVKSDGSATIDVIYERQSYKVTFTATNPETSEAIASSEIDVKYEGSITFPSSYHVKNYSLVWKYNGEVVNDDTKVTGNMTLVAEYTKIEKTIVIHSKGQQNVVISNVDAGSIVVSHLEQPSRTGYTFGGWYLDEKFEEKLSSTVVMPEDNLDIYVKWNINQYTISFDSGVTSITQDYGTVVTAPANPSKTGYIFGGWLRNGQPYSFSTMPAEDVELVAKWEPISYSIVFDGNGGNGTTSSLNNVEYDVTVNLTAVGFSKVGHDFLGWSLDKNATVATYQNNQEVINLSSENGETITLYAVWQIQSYEISFDEAGGSVVTGDKEYDYGTVIKLPKTTREGYDFLGWSDGKSLYKDSYTVSTSAVTFVAEWKAKSYTVTFIVNDGTNNQYTQSFEFDKQEALTDFTGSREGYTFKGWSTTENGEVKYKDGDNYVTPAEDVTLYGVWQIQSYELSIDLNGGSLETNPAGNYDYNASISLSTPTKEGHTFLGWYEGNNLYNGTTMPARDVILKAEWKVNSYKLTLDANGGSGTFEVDFVYGVSTNLPSSEGIVKEGYDFLGWSTTPTGTVKYQNTQEFTIGAEPVTLYAVWEIKEYTYTFIVGTLDDENVGEDDPNKDIIINITHGESVSVPEMESYRDSSSIYKFDGWYLNSSCEGDKAYIAPNNSGTYYGKYIPNPYKIIYQDEEAGNQIFSMDANGENITFMTHVNYLYAKYLGYDHIMASLENAIDANAKLQLGALTNKSPEYALGMSDYVVNAVYFSCKMNNTNNFNDVSDEDKILIIVGGALTKLSIDENEATDIGLDLRSKAIETLAKLDVFDINDVDKNYVLSILNFANANEEAVRATTDNRKETILTYNNYKEHGFVPSKNGKYFYMWDEQINTETNNVYVAAQWLSKVSTPLNVRVLSTHSSKVTYSWNAVSGVTNYEVYYSINGGAPVTVRVKELAYTIPGLENGDEVEFKVKAINPISEFAPKIEVTGPDGELVVIDEVEVNSDYSKVIEYVHSSRSNADVTAQGEYYYVLDNGTFVFFESKYYSFSNIDHIDIVDINGDKVIESPSAEYLEFTGSDNKLVRQLNILGTGSLNNEFYFKVYRPVANNEVYDSTNEYYQKLTTGSYEVVENPASIDGLYVGVQYRGQINSIVNGLASGEKMNSYLNNTNVENSSLYLNKDFKTYSVGTTSEPQTITVNKDVNGEFIVPLNQGTTEYYYNQLVDETLDTKTYNQYTNGYRFDFEVQANGGITLDGTEFALDYKFFDINGNPIEPSNLYYAYDEENDAFFFKDGVTGKFKVEVAPKLDGFYKTSDKVVVEGKQYYSAPDKTALVTNPSKNGLSTYYEYYQNIDLPKVVKENINLSKYSKEFTFELKDGINVFTQNGLRNAFADTSVSGIIIHSDIKAELHPSQVVYYEYDVPGYSYQKAQYGQIKLDTSYPVEFTTENGYGEKIWSTSKNDSYSIKDKNGTTYYYVGDGGTHSIKDAKFYYDFDKDATTGSFYMLNNYMQQKPNSNFNTASIFTRGWANSENGKYVSAEDLVIEGNYYTIDGSDLPYITTQFNVGSLFGSTYHIQNVSVSLFETLTYANTTYRNLEIIGNTSNANNTINSEGQTLSIKDYMEMTSGGYIGIRAHEHNTEPSGRSKPEGEGATKVTTENVIVRNCVLGFSVSDYAVAEINDTYITDIWGNGVYGHGGTTYSFNNLKIRNCGGPAVDIEDNYTGMGMKNPIVELSLGQMDIGNYISGEEPWFKAYNMEVIAMGMKSQVDAMLQAKGQSSLTCIKIHTDETTGLTSEKINLVYLANDKIANNLDTPSIVEGVNTNMTGLQELAPGSGLYCYDPEVALATRLGEEAAKAKAEGNLELAASLQAQALQTLDNSIAKGVLNGNEKYYLKTNKEIAGNRFTIIMELYGHPTM